MNITHIDALTGTNTVTTVTKTEFAAIVGDIAPTKPLDQIISEQAALKASAIAKLAALGLTEDEAKAVIG